MKSWKKKMGIRKTFHKRIKHEEYLLLYKAITQFGN